MVASRWRAARTLGTTAALEWPVNSRALVGLPGVALILRGLKVTGKDTFVDYMKRIVGLENCPTIAQPEHLTGKFNSDFSTALLLHVQEGEWAGNRKAENVLKYLVTSTEVAIERKGVDRFTLPSYFRIVVTSNAEWTVPATGDERRWAVFNVSDKRKDDREYYRRLRAEMEGDGPAALMGYLLSIDLSDFDVRTPPQTIGLSEQKIASLRNMEAWWHERLCEGVLLSEGWLFDEDDWEAPIGRDRLRRDYERWLEKRRAYGHGDLLNSRRFGTGLRRLVKVADVRPGNGLDTRQRCYRFPSLRECRKQFEAAMKLKTDWESY